MMLIKRMPVIVGLMGLLGACVAPEAPPQARVSRPAAAPVQTGSSARFEDAPIPNRRAGKPSDSVISIQN